MAAAPIEGNMVNASYPNAANWDTVPASTDFVRIITSAVDVVDDLAAHLAFTYADLMIGEGVVDEIGTIATPLEVSSDTMTMRGGGDLLHIKGDIPEIFAAPKSHATQAFNIQGKSNGGNVNTYCSRGRTLLNGSFSMVNAFVLPGANDAVCRIEDITMTGDVHVEAGILELGGAAAITGTLFVAGGGLVKCQTATIALANIQLINGGTLEFDFGSISGSVIVKGGFFDGHKHTKRIEIGDDFTVIGGASRVNLRTGTKSIVMAAGKVQRAIGNPLLTLDDGESF